MRIESLSLKNYRNYRELNIDLSPTLNIFVGNNAQGKSNILESVFVLGLTKSYMNVKDCYLIKDDEEYSKLSASVISHDVKNNFEIILGSSFKKLKINHFDIYKYSEYISRIKVLIFSPYNVNFVKDGPHVRRKSINIVISQFSNSYVSLLQQFNIILKKRNQFLKTIHDFNNSNRIYFDMINERFVALSVEIFLKRYEFIMQINKILPDIYSRITGYDNLELKYNGSGLFFLEDKDQMIIEFKKKLNSIFDREKVLGMTLFGPHRDDFIFYLDGKELSIYGSQGQIRAAILAMKLAEVTIFKEKDDDYPILLLDDIFSELDIEKRNKIVKYILNDVQTIITTTDVNLLDDELVSKARIFFVKDGMIVDEGKKECKNE